VCREDRSKSEREGDNESRVGIRSPAKISPSLFSRSANDCSNVIAKIYGQAIYFAKYCIMIHVVESAKSIKTTD